MNAVDPVESEARTIRALIDAAARQFAEAPALVSLESGVQRSFVELRDAAAVIARRLAGLGLRPGDAVALAMENGVATAELMLAAMYGGFVAVPLDVGAGPAKLGHALHNAAPKVLFAGDAHCAEIAALAAAHGHPFTVIPTDPDRGPVWDERPPAAALHAVAPDDEAFVIYTSGSTGQPRGASFSQARISACAPHSVMVHQLAAADRFLCVLPLYHLNSVEKLLGILVSGSAILLPRRFALSRFWHWVSDQRCTWSALVPTLVAQLVRWTDPRAEGLSFDHVRFMRCSSAPLSEAQHRAFEERFGIALIQGMGMSEAGYIFSNPTPPATRKLGSIGVPWRFEARVVDAGGRALPDGEVGEIVVRGPSVMSGYRGDPTGTATQIDAAGWLHSGDLGYRDADGYYFIVGRAKEMIIKAGVNIAPREIDQALESHPDVLEAAALGVPDPLLGEDIVAYVVPRPGASTTEHELIALCERRLGAFRAPARIHLVESLPKGPSGKVQRLELRGRSEPAHAPGPAGVDDGAPPLCGGQATPPRTPLERLVGALWCELLGLPSIDVHAHFFVLGGSSMLGVQILSRLRQRLPVALSLRMFFEHPTVAGQALLIGAALAEVLPEPPRGAAQLRRVALAERERLEAALLDAAGDRPPPARRASASAALLLPVSSTCVTLPLFCAYGPAQYGELAQCLGAQQPTYGLFVERELEIVLGEQERSSSFVTVETLAGHYREALRQVQPHGPYRLAGYSFGGRLALEMARQLRSEGEEIALLAVVDTYLSARSVSPVRAWLADAAARVMPGLAERGNARRAEPSAPAEMVARMAEREEAYRREAGARHAPRPYDGRVVLCVAAQALEPNRRRIDPRQGWRAIANGGLEVHEIPGDHHSMMRHPHVAALAAVLRPRLGV